MPIGVPELLIILVIVLLVLGPRRLPALGRQLGGGLREFKDSISGRPGAHEGDDDAARDAPATPTGELPSGRRPEVADPEPAVSPAATGAGDEPAPRPSP